MQKRQVHARRLNGSTSRAGRGTRGIANNFGVHCRAACSWISLNWKSRIAGSPGLMWIVWRRVPALRCFASTSYSPGGQRGQGEVAVCVGDGEEGMIERSDVGKFPGMHVALQANRFFGFGQLDRALAAGHLGVVPLGISRGGEMDVVKLRTGVLHENGLAGLHHGEVWFKNASELADHMRLGRDLHFSVGQSFCDPYNDVCQAAIGANGIEPGGGRLRMGAGTIGWQREDFFRRGFAFQRCPASNLDFIRRGVVRGANSDGD